MKEIVKKVLSAGLVDKHTVELMERWGALERGTSEMVDNRVKLTEQQLVCFAEDIERLLEEERENLRETRLTIQIGDPTVVRILESDQGNVVAWRDEMGNFLLPPGTKNVEVDDVLYVPSEGAHYGILAIEPLYSGDVAYALQLDTRLLDVESRRRR